MLMKSRLIPFGSCVALGLILASCTVEDTSQRQRVETENWTTTPEGTTYSYTKCEVSSPRHLINFCGQRPGNPQTGTEATPYTYNWKTNCQGDQCATVSVFAHYELSTDLGADQSLRIEAFDNPQFRSYPIASLEISGFDASHPNSTGREEMYLAPGEYYFRAYITHDGDQPMPYPFAGMELVDDRPVGFLGALSGAERVVIESPKDQDVIHIAIDQLYKKNQPEPDTLAKLRLQIAVDPSVTIPNARNLHIVLSTDANLEATPAYDFTLSTNELLVKGQENQADFVSPSLAPGSYYVFSYIDANDNGFADPEEGGAYVLEAGDPAVVKIEKNRTRNVKIHLPAKPMPAE